MDDPYGQEGMSEEMDDEDSMNFDQDPNYAHLPQLDKMRKVRREIVRTVNDIRERFGHPGVYLDNFTNKAAMEYARLLLDEKQDENPEALA